VSNRRLVIESKCDKSRYRLSVDPDAVVLGVTYRHFAGRYEKMVSQKVEEATIGYYRAMKTDGAPETENEAAWFLRAIYEHHQGRRAFWFYFKPTQTLIVCPPPPDSGSLISVLVEEPIEELLDITPEVESLRDSLLEIMIDKQIVF
jgi:hypothetical protein